MSDKLTAYRGDYNQPHQDGEVSQQGYGIDPHTGQPIQAWQQGTDRSMNNGQQSDQNYYSQAHNGAYGNGAGNAAQYNQNYNQQPAETDPYQAHYNQSAADQYGHAHQGYTQYGQAQQGQQEVPTYQDANGQWYYGHAPEEQGNEYNYQQEYDQSAYAAEEVNPYMAAHQNATPPYDASARNQYSQNPQYDYQAQSYEQGQQYQDPNAYANSYQDQQYYQQAQVDTGQSPALYNGAQDGASSYYQQGVTAGLPAPEGYGYDQQNYGDYNNQYNSQNLQPIQQGMPQINDPYAPTAALNASKADVSYDSDVQTSGRKSFLVGTMILGSVIIGGGVAFAYKYSGDTDGKAPVIISDGGTLKASPENPGGREFENQNKKIFARLGDAGAKVAVMSQDEPEVVESLRGKVSENNSSQAGDDSADKVASDSEADDPNSPRLVRTYRINRNGEQILDSRPSKIAVAGEDVKDIAGVSVDTGQPARAVRTLNEGANAKPVVRERQVAAVSSTASNDGDFVVQISARRTQQDALAAFSGLQQKYGSVLGNYRPLIQRADLGSRGIWYRLRVGPMKSKEDAAKVCADLKSNGMSNCLVASR